jgi:hypothetical protein
LPSRDAEALGHDEGGRQRRNGRMREQPVDMGGIVRDLRVVPVMRMAGRAPDTGGQRRRHAGAPGRRQRRIGPSALFERVSDEDLDRMLAAAGEIEAERIDDAASPDPQRLGRQVGIGGGLDEAESLAGDVAGGCAHGSSFSVRWFAIRRVLAVATWLK